MTTKSKQKEFSSKESIGYLTSVAYRSMNKRLSNNLKLLGIKLSAEQYGLLKRLWQEEGLTQLDLAKLTSKDKPSITRLLNNLEKKKLITRKVNKEDKRCNKIYLTEAGKKLEETCLKVAAQTVAEATKNNEKKDIQICKNVLAQICENLVSKNNNY